MQFSTPSKCLFIETFFFQIKFWTERRIKSLYSLLKRTVFLLANLTAFPDSTIWPTATTRTLSESQNEFFEVLTPPLVSVSKYFKCWATLFFHDDTSFFSYYYSNTMLQKTYFYFINHIYSTERKWVTAAYPFNA